MPDLDSEIRDIKQRISLAQASRARAEVERDAAAAAVEKTRVRLKEEFAVGTPEEAKAKLLELESALASVIELAKQALEKTE